MTQRARRRGSTSNKEPLFDENGWVRTGLFQRVNKGHLLSLVRIEEKVYNRF